MEKENEIRYVTRSKLRPFRYHPYLVREDEEMANLVNSIRENGVIGLSTLFWTISMRTF